MALELSTNFAVSTVATAPSPASSGTSLVVDAGHGARFPDPTVANFNCVVCPADAQPTPANAEIVRVTARSTDTFTITRTQESSSARSIVVGDRIFAGVTVKTLDDIWDDLNLKSLDLALGVVRKDFLNAKGDLISASAADTPALLAAGSNEEVPIYDSGQAAGFKKGAPLGALKGYVPILQTPMGVRGAASGAFTRGILNQTLASGYFGFTASPSAVGILGAIPLSGTNFNVSGRTTQLKTVITVFTNATAPTVSWTVGLSLLASAGGAGVQSHSWSTEVSGSTATVTTPSASAVTTAISSAFTLPADGAYALVTTQSGTSAANSSVAIQLGLWVNHT